VLLTVFDIVVLRDLINVEGDSLVVGLRW
jgi:hypothetical protein